MVFEKIKNKTNKLNNRFIEFTESKWFVLIVTSIFFFVGLCHGLYKYGLIDLIIEYFSVNAQGDEIKKPTSNFNLNLSVTISEAVTMAGIGIGASKMIKACPPQTRAGVAIGISVITGTTILTKSVIDSYKSASNSSKIISSSTGSGSNIIRSPIENQLFENMSIECQLFIIILIFLLVSLYFMVGLLMLLITNYYISSDRLEKLKLKYPWLYWLLNRYKVSSKITVLIMILAIIYSLSMSIFIISYYLTNQ